MANGNGIWNLKAVLLVLSILLIIVGATITFANKVDRAEIVVCVAAIEKKITDGDDKLERKFESNQKEIINLIKLLAGKK